MSFHFFTKHILRALVCVLFLICLSVTLTVLFRPLYYWDMGHLSIPESSGVSEKACRENYDVLIDYNLLGGPSELAFPDFIMSENGRIHFQEVKRIFLFCQAASMAGAVWFVWSIWRQLERSDRNFTWLRWTGRAALVLAALVGGLVAVSWDTAFVVMHKILFRNDLWLFNAATDPVITILPDTFFMHCGILILTLLMFFVAACRFLAGKLEKRSVKP